MVGALLLVLLVVAVIMGTVAGRRASSDRIDRWTAGVAALFALLGVVVSVVTVGAGAGVDADEVPIFLAFLVAPLVLTGIPFVLRGRAIGTAALTAVCAMVLVTYVVITGLSVGWFFAPAATALVMLATARMSRGVARCSPEGGAAADEAASGRTRARRRSRSWGWRASVQRVVSRLGRRRPRGRRVWLHQPGRPNRTSTPGA